MRHVVWLVLLTVVGAAVGVASARAGGTGTTTTGTTTTGTTTTTPAPSYARLAPSYLPKSCVGAGAALIEEPGRRPLALGTPASNLGPSAYPSGTPLIAFDSLAASGSTCSSTSVTLTAVSLFGGAVTATSISGTGGRGTVTGLQVDGADVNLGVGGEVAVGNWGQVTLERKVGRARAILVLSLLATHGSLPAGTDIAVGFEAAPQPVAKPKPTHPPADGQTAPTAPTAKNGKRSKANSNAKRQSQKPPPDFPATASPLAADGGLTDAVRDNPVVSIAMKYLGVPYQWGGASPKTGFDCSGLVMYVFAQLGVPLIHYAAAQYHAPGGVWVAPNRLQPGDLVFFTGSDGTRKAPGHVGIYLDDGYIIDAPHTGAFVRIDSLNEPRLANQYVGARDILGASLEPRHLLHATDPAASSTVLPSGFRPEIAIAPVGESLGVAAAGTTAASSSSAYWIWAVVVLAGVMLLVTGGLVIRRRVSVTLSPNPPSGPPTDQ